MIEWAFAARHLRIALELLHAARDLAAAKPLSPRSARPCH
jgi:hypothetical protein